MNLKRVQLKEEIGKLLTIKNQLDKKAEMRNKVFFSAASLFFAAQFGVGYYCIYEVEWLGWDLFEPLTYTVAQGLFVTGIIYSLRNLGQDTAFSSIDKHYKNKRLEKWLQKKGVEPDRLTFLEEELKKIEDEIQATEAQRYA